MRLRSRRSLNQWGQELRSGVRSLTAPANFLAASFKAASLVPHEQEPLRSGNGVGAVRRKFPAEPFLGRERFLEELRTYLAPLGQVLTAEFEIVHIEQTASSPITVRIEIHYDLVGVQEDEDKGREERIGNWDRMDAR